MSGCKVFVVLLCCCSVYTAPSENISDKKSENDSKKESSEVVGANIPDNLNIADYYYSIFGKHLDYDYREPLFTFDEQTHNDISDEIESEVDKTSDDKIWDVHTRKKRFILVPANYYNATRRWLQQRRKLRAERRRLRTNRRDRWQRNRITYLNARSDALKRQATRLTNIQERRQQIIETRSANLKNQNNAKASPSAISENTAAASTTITSTSSSTNSDTLTASESKQIPVKQVPLPTQSSEVIVTLK